MRRQLTAVVSFAFVATSGAVLAHHSFAMFDQENPIELRTGMLCSHSAMGGETEDESTARLESGVRP